MYKFSDSYLANLLIIMTKMRKLTLTIKYHKINSYNSYNTIGKKKHTYTCTKVLCILTFLITQNIEYGVLSFTNTNEHNLTPSVISSLSSVSCQPALCQLLLLNFSLLVRRLSKDNSVIFVN